MAKSKKATVPICINIPCKLMRRLDRMLADLRAREEYGHISRSAFLSHALKEWLMILDNPAREPAPAEVRRRIRSASKTTPNGMSKLTPAKVRALRKDCRSFEKIAADLGVNASTIARARSGETWAWVD